MFFTDRLDAELVKLAVSSRLRPVVAKERPEVKEPNRLRLLVKARLKVGAHDGGGAFGPQRERSVAPVPEGVHLF